MNVVDLFLRNFEKKRTKILHNDVRSCMFSNKIFIVCNICFVICRLLVCFNKVKIISWMLCSKKYLKNIQQINY